MKLRSILGRLLAAAFLFVAAWLWAKDFSRQGFDPGRLALIREVMQRYVDQGELAGTVTLIAQNGKIEHLEAVGWRDLANKKPMQPDTIFQVMSMTKPFTATAIMMLVDDAKLSLNDPVKLYLPYFAQQQVRERQPDGTETLRSPKRPVTIRDLMTHTSGMQTRPQAELANIYQDLDVGLSAVVERYAQEPLEFDPGTGWRYSNLAVATLGLIIETVTGKPYYDFVTDRILRPLRMNDSFFLAPSEKLERIAYSYIKDDGRLVLRDSKRPLKYPPRERNGAKLTLPEVGLYSTAADLFRFHQMMLNRGELDGQRILSPASFEVMTMPHTGNLKSGKQPGMQGTATGMIWEVVTEPLGTTTLMSLGSFGHGGAYGTHGWVDPKKRLVGIFMTQTSFEKAVHSFFQLAGAAATE